MLTPEDIRSRSFLVSLRGYDRDEVSAFLDELAAEVEALRDTAQAPPGPAAAQEAAEPAELFAQIGQETQRILEAAQQAGEELRRQAQDEVTKLRTQAEGETTQLRERTEAETNELRQRTESESAKLRQQATAETDALRQRTESEAAELRQQATAETDALRRRTEEETQALRQAAQQEAVELREQTKEAVERELKSARARATKLIAEGERRRETMERELIELTQAREAVVQQLREVGRTLERVLREVGGSAETATSVREALEGTAREEAGQESPAHRQPDEAAGQADEGPPLDALPAEAAAHIERRNHALATLQPKLVRKLKRGLQDLQNGTLDRLRREGGRGEAERFLPHEAAVRSLGVLAEEHLVAAHAAGVSASEELSGREVELGPTDRELHVALVDELGSTLVDALGEVLSEGMEAEEDLAALGERVDGVFNDLKSGLVDAAGVVALVGAFELGAYDGWRAAGIQARRYVIAREPRCTDERCAENAGAGAVPMDQSFPSGHDAPPVGPYCQCTTIPSLENQS